MTGGVTTETSGSRMKVKTFRNRRKRSFPHLDKSVKALRNFVRGRAKYIDSSVVQSNTANTGTIINLSDVAEGNDVAQRNGQLITMDRLTFKGYVQQNSTPNQDDCIKVMLVIDTSNTGTAPVLSDVLATAGTTNSPVSPVNILSHGRFKVLYHKIFALSQTGPEMLVFGDSINFNKKAIRKYAKAEYTGSAGTNIWKNQLYLVLCSGGTLNNPLVSGYFRLKFYDA